MGNLIWLFIIIIIANSFSAAKKKQGQANKGGAQQQKPVYKPQTTLPQHPYSPVAPAPSAEAAPAPQAAVPRPVSAAPVQPKPKPAVRPSQKTAKPAAAVPGMPVKGSLEGLPLEYNLREKAAEANTAAVSLRGGKPLFSQDELINGIIMSEVLSKPKALRR